MSNHTKAPWLFDGKVVYALNEKKGVECFFCVCAGDGKTDEDELKANAHRIVACVNACEGISTDTLMQCNIADRITQLERQRDRLLEALELMVSTQTDGGWTSAALVIAQAAIASVKGGIE